MGEQSDLITVNASLRRQLAEAHEDLNDAKGALNEVAKKFGIELLPLSLKARIYGLSLGFEGALADLKAKEKQK